MKILIVEDEPALRELIQRSLEKERMWWKSLPILILLYAR